MEFNVTLLGQAITFAILVWFTMKFVWPPLTNMMDERAKRIADGLAAGERGKQDLEAAEKRVADELRKAKQQATEIVMAAEKRASQIVDEAKDVARVEGARIVADAKSEIDQEVLRAKETLRAQVADLAVAGAEKILRKEIDSAKHADLLASIKAEF
ncbi:F-type H+-transporting ATPase subunit b [Chromobacterium alkanivorans]|uniref:ATP synthase subunit b n=1 Tax=Chromobacterium fluminis TaxID=3044269 RepID=A0ABX0L3Q4_9NEIS|nr:MULTISPECIES: F0F1 ATP synthase subunit B [Chromobacterium]MBN3002259.1 F0F1 ATP synthase subunit B [Chromobacterium alkanivorans]KMN82899.1 ATP synthase subunit B [Chromobacterium sp. LK11]MCS3803460.1 F-type H+-transporting ATPase subunit b [Chromobacterium alkanivorans]MCS3817430.1 F-type H+-transporting ATPase subunit b [Chromobacterium alkanivorans]MCS3872826.1 F-type H+-transporting ATPase subunit b [Chromobacterium alkanivorans]